MPGTSIALQAHDDNPCLPSSKFIAEPPHNASQLNVPDSQEQQLEPPCFLTAQSIPAEPLALNSSMVSQPLPP
jgi:hypothetical protein